MNSYPRVYIIVLNYNKYDYTKRCLESLHASDYPNHHIVLIDNGSSDGSSQRLQNEFPDITYIFNEKNVGFARGVNVGIRHALLDPDCAYVLLFNNDAIMLPTYLRRAIETAESDPQIGIVGGKTYQDQTSNVISYAGGEIHTWTASTVAYGIGQEDTGEYDKVCQTTYIPGAMMVIKRRVLETVGLLPEVYFFGTEDIDYCIAARQGGFKLYYIPTLAAYHLGGGSFWSWEPKWTYNFYRNKLTLLRRHLPFWVLPFYRILIVLYAYTLAPRRWQTIADKHGFTNTRAYSFEDMQRAMLQAVRDHNKPPISEEVLSEFEQSFKGRQRLDTCDDILRD